MDSTTTTAPRPAVHSPDDLLSVCEAAAMLRTSVMTLNNWRWQARGPRFHKIGARIVRYKRADLVAFIEAGAVGKTETPRVTA